MAVYAMADLHLSLSVNKPMEVFGHRWQDHADRIEQAWRATVRENDTVVVPGDISWGIDLEEAKADLLWLDRLPGKKLLGKGNHDYWWMTVKKMEQFFSEHGITTLSFLYNRAEIAEGLTLCGCRGWFVGEKLSPKEVDYQKIVLREAGRLERSLLDGKRQCEIEGIPFVPLAFLHFPPVFGPYVTAEIVEVLQRYQVKDCYFGHIHGVYDAPACAEYEGIRYHLISADYLNFTPLRLPDMNNL